MKASNVYFTEDMCYVEFPINKIEDDTQYPYVIKGVRFSKLRDSKNLAFLINTTLFKLSEEYCTCNKMTVTEEGLKVFNKSILPDMVPYLTTLEMLEWKGINLLQINNLLEILGYSKLKLQRSPISELLCSLIKHFRIIDLKTVGDIKLRELKDNQFIEATFKGIAFDKIMTFTLVNENIDLFDITKYTHKMFDYTDEQCRIASAIIGGSLYKTLVDDVNVVTTVENSYTKTKGAFTISEFVET